MDDRRESIGFDFLVGCDGARSRVAESFGLGRNREFLSGVELEFEGVRDLDDDCLHVFIDTKLAPGYIAWVVPGVGITQVGLAVRKRVLRPVVPVLGRDAREVLGLRSSLVHAPRRPLGEVR